MSLQAFCIFHLVQCPPFEPSIVVGHAACLLVRFPSCLVIISHDIPSIHPIYQCIYNELINIYICIISRSQMIYCSISLYHLGQGHINPHPRPLHIFYLQCSLDGLCASTRPSTETGVEPAHGALSDKKRCWPSSNEDHLAELDHRHWGHTAKAAEMGIELVERRFYEQKWDYI